jgi:hypothetical protein
MCPSTEITDKQSEFAAEVLRKLLRHIEAETAEGRGPYLVSHAWTNGPMIHLVYKAPPFDIIWGLVRDTRRSIIGPGPWPDPDEAVTYYYLLDLEEGCATSDYPSEPDRILWCGFPLTEDLPERPSDIPEKHRYTPPPRTRSTEGARSQDQPVVNEPRRYADPF